MIVALLLPACGARSSLGSADGATLGAGGSTLDAGGPRASCAGWYFNLTVAGAVTPLEFGCAWGGPPPLPTPFAQALVGDPSSAGIVVEACETSSPSSLGVSFATSDAFVPGTYTTGSYAGDSQWVISGGLPFSLTLSDVGPVGGLVEGSFQYGTVQAQFSVCRAPDATAPAKPPHP
jgi:hypothetical protein